MHVKQYKGQQYPEVKAYNEPQVKQLLAESQYKHPLEQGLHIPSDK